MPNNNIKSAIARVFMAIINADGIISSRELQCLDRNDKNDLMHKYGLKQKNFEDAELTFAEAVNLIMSAEGTRYLEERGLNKVSLSIDMENLARADGGIHPKEALLCLSFRLAMEGEGSLSLVSFNNNELRFSKQEIIYVENEMDEDLNKEISNSYEVICDVLQSYGFRFIYIPKVRDAFFGFLPEYKLQLIKYYYPEKYTDNKEKELLEQFNNKLQTDIDEKPVTKSFCEMLFEGNIQGIEPSFLIKIGTTQKRNPNGLTDFIMLRIRQEGALYTITKEFLYKYDKLCEKNNVLVQRGGIPNGLNSKSFHKTFLEYLYSRVIAINIQVKKAAVVFCFNDLDKMSMSKGLSSALYMTELYFACKGDSFVNPTLTDRDNDITLMAKMETQYELFNRIYFELNGVVYRMYDYHLKKDVQVPFDEFYRTFTKNHIRIIGKLKDDMRCLKRFFPSYDSDSKCIQIPRTNCYVYDYEKRDKEDENTPISLITWADGLKPGVS